MTIKEWQDEIHANAIDKGWWETERNVGELLCLVHTEISEAYEEFRNGNPLDDYYCHLETGKPEGFPIELADAVIRILDIAESCGFDMESMMEMKHEFNKSRPYRHGGKLA